MHAHASVVRTHLVSGEHVPALSVGLRERPPGELQVKVKVVSRRVHELRLDEAEELGVVFAAAGETLARLPADSTDTAPCSRQIEVQDGHHQSFHWLTFNI